MDSNPYVVIDLETTGFGPQDRVIEIGLVLLDGNAEIEGTWESLVQPNRDIPNTFVHGISAADVVGAPTFREIGAHLQSLLEGRTLVAHNAPFEIRFLTAEFARLGVDFSNVASCVIDTQRLGRQLLHNSPRSLVDCIAAAGIHNDRPHAALSDAFATAELLRYLLPKTADLAINHHTMSFTQRLVPLEFRATTRNEGPAQPGHWLQRLASQLPKTGDSDYDAYRSLLSVVLTDRDVSATEAEQLVGKAEEIGISREEVLDIHFEFLQQLSVEAWLDGVVTDEEAAMLQKVGEQLGIEKLRVAQLLAEPTTGDLPQSIVLTFGDRVAFTGELSTARAVWENRVRSAGLDVGGVTKKTVCVVAAQPDSRSSKARRARELNIPIVDEGTFARLLSALALQDASGSDLLIETDVYAEDSFDRRSFPWIEQLDVDVLTLDDVVSSWICFYPNSPLVEMSPLLNHDTHFDFFVEPKGSFATWRHSHPRPLAASVDDLRDLRGVGNRKLSAMVKALVLETVDLEPIFGADFVSEQPQVATEEDEILANSRYMWGLYNLMGAISGEKIDLPAPLAEKRKMIAPYFAESERAVFEQFVAELRTVFGIDRRFSAILERRWIGGATLEELGSSFDVTRERARQLESQLRIAFADKAPTVQVLCDIITRRFLPITKRETVFHVIPMLARTVPDLSVSFFDVLTAVNESWIVKDGYVAAPNFDDRLKQTLEELSNYAGVASLNEVATCLEISQELVVEKINNDPSFRYLLIDDHILTNPNSTSDRAVAVLSILGRPASIDEILEFLGSGNRRTAGNAMNADERLCKVSAEKWALKEWGMREFRTIAEWIGEEVDKTGSVQLQALLEQADAFDISQNSIRTYASSGEFVIQDGIVSRGSGDITVDAAIEEAKHMYLRDGHWKMLLTVTYDHLRGSGFGGPRALINYYDIPYLGEVQLSSPLGEQMIRFSRAAGAQVSTIKRFLDQLGSKVGDRVWLTFAEDRSFLVEPAISVIPGLTGWDLVLNSCGIEIPEPADDQHKQALVNAALGLDPTAPRRRTVSSFRHRGQDDIADLIQTL